VARITFVAANATVQQLVNASRGGCSLASPRDSNFRWSASFDSIPGACNCESIACDRIEFGPRKYFGIEKDIERPLIDHALVQLRFKRRCRLGTGQEDCRSSEIVRSGLSLAWGTPRRGACRIVEILSMSGSQTQIFCDSGPGSYSRGDF